MFVLNYVIDVLENLMTMMMMLLFLLLMMMINELLFVRICRCSCLDWQPASTHSREVKQAAEHVVAMVNNMTSSHAGLCARLRVSDVMSAVRYVTSDHVLRFRKSSDLHGRVAEFTDHMKPNVVSRAASFVCYVSVTCDAVQSCRVVLSLGTIWKNTHTHTHTRTRRYHGCFPVKPGLPDCRFPLILTARRCLTSVSSRI